MAGYERLRVLFALLNVPIFLVGVFLFVLGILLKLESGFVSPEVTTLLNHVDYNIVETGNLTVALSYLMIAAGLGVCGLAFLGFIGALTRLRNCIVAYVFLVAIIIVAQTSVLVLCVDFRTRIDEWVEEQMLSLLAKYRGPLETDDISKGWNRMFMDVGCCGVRSIPNSTEFSEQQSVWFSNHGPIEKVPATCCKGVSMATVPDFINSTTCTQGPTNFYTEGCSSVMRRYTRTYSSVIFVMMGAIIFIEVVNVLLGCVTVDTITEKRTKRGHQEEEPPLNII